MSSLQSWELAQREIERQRLDQLVRWMKRQRSALTQMQAVIGQARQAARTGSAELCNVQAQMKALEEDLARERTAIMTEMGSAAQLVVRIEQAAFQGVMFLGTLVAPELDGRKLEAQQQLIEQRLNQLTREVSFVTRDAALSPAAMLTLTAMRANGYELRETLSEQGLISYFQQEGTGHHIAVRVAHMGPVPGTDTERWDLLAETCGPPGNQCLEEMMDFETAVQLLDLGELRRNGGRVCPKDGTDSAAEHWVRLPPPPTPETSRDCAKTRTTAEQKKELS